MTCDNDTAVKYHMIMVEMATSCASTKDLSQTINKTIEGFGFQLKQVQMQAIRSCMKGGDVFVSLPTSYSKSLCYSLPTAQHIQCSLLYSKLPFFSSLKNFRH